MKKGTIMKELRVDHCTEATEQLLSELELIEQRTMKNPWSAQSLKECFDKSYKMLVLFYGDQVAGFAVIYNTKVTTDLLTIAVDPQYQGQGFGRFLLKKTLHEAVKGGADECFLEVRESNIRAQNLYKSMGFQIVGIRKNYYEATGNTKAENAFTMSVSELNKCKF